MDVVASDSFLGHPVRPASESTPADCDRLIIAPLDDADQVIARPAAP